MNPRVPPAYVDIDGVAALLGVTRRRVAELRRDQGFPAGRLFGGGGTLRFPVAAVLAWAEQQPAAKWATVGSARRWRRDPEAA